MDNEPVQLNDLERLLVDDKAEWAESLDAIVAQYGAAGAREILRSLQNHVLGLNIPLDEATLNTPYRNTELASSRGAAPTAAAPMPAQALGLATDAKSRAL